MGVDKFGEGIEWAIEFWVWVWISAGFPVPSPTATRILIRPGLIFLVPPL